MLQGLIEADARVGGIRTEGRVTAGPAVAAIEADAASNHEVDLMVRAHRVAVLQVIARAGRLVPVRTRVRRVGTVAATEADEASNRAHHGPLVIVLTDLGFRKKSGIVSALNDSPGILVPLVRAGQQHPVTTAIEVLSALIATTTVRNEVLNVRNEVRVPS